MAIIPARGGSKGVPRKNLRNLKGRPLLGWTLESARESGLFDKIVVSTEDSEIYSFAEHSGFRPPFLRPADLAADDTPTWKVVVHALEWLQKNESYQPDVFVLLQPTSPLRTEHDIREAMKIFQEKKAHSLMSVSPVTEHPLLMATLTGEMKLKRYVTSSGAVTRRQDMPEYYFINGAIYIRQTKDFLKNPSFDMEGSVAYVMPPERSIDIDTLTDFKIAEALKEISEK